MVFKIIQYKFCDGAAGVGVVSLDHVFQLADVAFSNGVQLYHFAVAASGELAADIVYVCDATTHPGCKIPAGVTQDNDPAARHVFAAVVADAFDDSLYTGVADSKAFAGLTTDECFTGGSAIEGYVTDDAVLFGDESCILRRIDDEPCTGKTLTKIMICAAFKLEVHPMGIEGSEALAGCTGEFKVNGAFGKASAFICFACLVAEKSATRSA